jgi:hypothetical protein
MEIRDINLRNQSGKRDFIRKTRDAPDGYEENLFFTAPDPGAFFVNLLP